MSAKPKAAAFVAVLAILVYLFPSTAFLAFQAFGIFLAWLLYPMLLVNPVEFDMDSIASWAGKGPGAKDPAFPKKLAAPYYLDGNIAPDNKTLSPLMIMDFTYCKYDVKTRTMSFDSTAKMGFITCSTTVDPALQNATSGAKFYKMLAVLGACLSDPDARPLCRAASEGRAQSLCSLPRGTGFCYDIVWDETFESAQVLIRTKRLALFGTLPLIPSSVYRWWIADVKPDGSAFTRNTSFGGRLNPGKDMYKDPPTHSYYPVRLCFDGKVDQKVFAKMTGCWKGKLMSAA